MIRFRSGPLADNEYVYPLGWPPPTYIYAGAREGGVKILNADHHLGTDLDPLELYERVDYDDDDATYDHRPLAPYADHEATALFGSPDVGR